MEGQHRAPAPGDGAEAGKTSLDLSQKHFEYMDIYVGSYTENASHCFL